MNNPNNPYYRPPGQHNSSYDLPPVQSVVPLSQPPPFQQQGTLAPTAPHLSAPPSRPSSSMKMSHLLQPLSGPVTSTSPYAQPYDSASVSPTEGPTVLPDAHLSSNPPLLYQMGNPGQQPQHQLPPQKRAYRQRRKDPSCDACRERKVKVWSSTC